MSQLKTYFQPESGIISLDLLDSCFDVVQCVTGNIWRQSDRKLIFS